MWTNIYAILCEHMNTNMDVSKSRMTLMVPLRLSGMRLDIVPAMGTEINSDFWESWLTFFREVVTKHPHWPAYLNRIDGLVSAKPSLSVTIVRDKLVSELRPLVDQYRQTIAHMILLENGFVAMESGTSFGWYKLENATIPPDSVKGLGNPLYFGIHTQRYDTATRPSTGR